MLRESPPRIDSEMELLGFLETLKTSGVEQRALWSQTNITA